jgi:hypothetical protein
MEPSAAHLMTERIHDIEREASGSPMRFEHASRQAPSAWRREGGAAARRLSLALADLAAELDPATCRPSYGRE